LLQPLGVNDRTQEEGKSELKPYQEREQRTQNCVQWIKTYQLDEKLTKDEV
jgi:hypothetical protein